MGIPDKALVTETGLPVGKLGQQPRVGTAGGSAAAKVDALARVEATFEVWAWPPDSAATKVGAPARVEATFKMWAWPPADMGSVWVWETPKGKKVGTWGQITTGHGQAAVWPWKVS